MKAFRLLVLVFLLLYASPLAQRLSAATLPAAEDTSSSKSRISVAAGRATTLAVTPVQTAYILFNLADLPGAAVQIRYARLRLYFPRVTKSGGGLAISLVRSPWSEQSGGAEPVSSSSAAAWISPELLSARCFASVDVTASVQGWLSGADTNYGFAILSLDGTNLLLGAKEGTGSGYPAELEVELNPGDASVGTAQLAPNLFLTGTTTGNFSGNGAHLTNLNAGNLTGTTAGPFGGVGAALPSLGSAGSPDQTSGAAANVRNFGAVGDGVTDDSAAITAAMASVLGLGGAVYLPPGVYRCNVVVPSSITLTGAIESSQGSSSVASSLTRLMPFNGTQPLLRVPSSTGVILKNLALFGPGAYTAGSTGIRIAADSPGSRGVFSGFSTILEGVQCSGFETGFFIASYRVLVRQCAGTRCKFNFFISNPADGIARPTPGVSGYPSDHITLINCIAGFAQEASAGIDEVAPHRTSYGMYVNSARCVTLIGCDVGQCGTGVYLEQAIASLNCHVEGTDGPAIQVASAGSAVQLDAVSLLNAGGILLEGGSLSISSLFNNQSNYGGGDAMVGVKGRGFLRCDQPSIAQYMDSTGTLVAYGMSDGSRFSVTRSPAQLVNPGNTWTEVLWNAIETGDAVEAGTHPNYNLSSGRWKCPAARRYRFQYILPKAKSGGGRVFSKLDERADGKITRDFAINSDEDGSDGRPLQGSLSIDCLQGCTYSLSVKSDTPGILSVGGGGSPTSGHPTARLNVSPD